MTPHISQSATQELETLTWGVGLTVAYAQELETLTWGVGLTVAYEIALTSFGLRDWIVEAPRYPALTLIGS